ncbi:MAG: sigma-70 family RNA polymerase sigma factor [Candidatus Omnitrophota bacterium]
MKFNILFKKISPALKKTAIKYKNYVPLLDEEDLYQESCLYLWNKYSQGLPLGINESYAIKGCEFHLLNHLRTNREKANLLSLEEPFGGEDLRLKDIIPDKVNTLNCINRSITIHDIKNNGFTKREKQVFSFLLDGYTVREIGCKLGISHVMVVKLKHRIIKKWQQKEKGLPPEALAKEGYQER